MAKQAKPTSGGNNTVTVETPEVTATGVLSNSGVNAVFHSIPYAQFTGDFEASTSCVEHRVVDATTPADPTKVSDTVLTVTMPAGTEPGADLPVLVFIHGGSYLRGSHEQPEYTGEHFAARGVITVSVSYRLGTAGFIPFADEDPAHYRGVDDCQRALEWVQRNIESFGGDPTKVTVAGHSAGAGIVLWLCRKDHYRGAFRRAISLSPAFPRQAFSDRKSTLRRSLGTPVTRRHLTKLKENRPERFRRGFLRFGRRFRTDLPVGPALFDGAELSDIPLLVSSTTDEFNDMPILVRVEGRGQGWSKAMLKLIRRNLGLQVPAGSYLPLLDAHQRRTPLSVLVGDAMVRRYVSASADEAPGPVWVMSISGDDAHPALHSGELPAIFGSAPPTALFSLMLKVINGRDPGWSRYRRPGRLVREFSLIDGSHHDLEDPLKRVRVGFHKIRQWDY